MKNDLNTEILLLFLLFERRGGCWANSEKEIIIKKMEANKRNELSFRDVVGLEHYLQLRNNVVLVSQE